MSWKRLSYAISDLTGEWGSFWRDRYNEITLDGQDIFTLIKASYRENMAFRGVVQGMAILLLLGVLDWFLGHPVGARMAYLIPVFLATQRGGKRAGILLILASMLTLVLSNYNLPEAFRGTLAMEVIVGLTVMLVGMYLVDNTRKSLNRAHHVATHDPLTGAANRTGFNEFADAILSNAVVNESAVTVILVDCDNFKELNDKYGHAAGDQVLINLVKLLKKAVGHYGTVGRTGGDEFVAVIPRRRRPSVQKLMEEVRERFESITESQLHPATFSFGISEYRADGLSMTALIDSADRDMYRHKADRKGINTEVALSEVS